MVLKAEKIWIWILIQQSYNKIIFTKRKNLAQGFTFLEILVVITLVVIILSTTMPNFFNIFSKPYESEFNHLSKVLKILRNDAILKNNSYCLIFDLKKQQIMTSKEDLFGECEDNYLNKPKVLAPHVFSEDLILEEARLAEKNYVSTLESSNLHFGQIIY